MTLKKKLEEWQRVKKQIEDLYKKKGVIEKTIIDELEQIDPETYERKDEIDLNDAYKLALIYENNIDPLLVREHYPTIYNFGQKLYFDYKQAMLALEKSKDFWALMKICRVKTPKLKVVNKNAKGNVAGVRGRNKKVQNASQG